MLKSFTDRLGGSGCILLLLLVQGCMTKGVPEDSSVMDAPLQAGSESAASGLPVSSAETAAEVDAPKVSRGNLVAFDQALIAMQEGRVEEAEVLLQEITAEQPELAGPWVNLGQVYVARERFEDARLAFQNAIKANPRSCHAYNQLGVLSRQFGDFSGAEEFYQACLKQVPNFKEVYLNLGILYELYLGRLPEALAAYRQYQALSSEPDRKVTGWVMDLERRLGV